MGLKSGDKGRYNKERKKKLAKRVAMRAHFGKAQPTEGTSKTPVKAGKARSAKTSSAG